MVSHEIVVCYEDKALPSKGPGRIPCTFVAHFSLSALSSQGIELRIQRAGVDMSKPISMAKFLDRKKTTLTRAKSNQSVQTHLQRLKTL